MHKLSVQLFSLFICFLMPGIALCAGAADVYGVRQANLDQVDKSGELGQELHYLCLRQLGADCRDRLVLGGKPYLKETFTKARPGQRMSENQIRPLASIAFASAVLLKFGDYDERATGISRREMAVISISLVRELASHHVANTDKLSWWWGNEWQSAFWTAMTGQGAWLIWDRLPESSRRDVAKMVAYEADRFLNAPAPHNEFLDTKAEENAWNSDILVLAECMMPDNPNRNAWDEKAREYIVTSFATPADVSSSRVIDGKPLREWLQGPNVHPDYSLENHGFFHPDYESAYYLSMQNMIAYRLAGLEPPESIFFNVKQLRDIIDFLTLPSGWTFYPQCTDWGNYRSDVTIMAQMPNPVIPDAAGARCLRWGLDFIRYADKANGEGLSKNLFRNLNFNCCPLDTMTHVYLMHYLLGPGAEPLSDEQAREQLCGTRLFEQGKCIVCRSRDGIASFSWFNSDKRLMAAVTPLDNDVFALPKFRSLIGTVGDKIDDLKIIRRETGLLPGGGFSVGIDCVRGPEPGLNERVMMVALPDGRVVYAEWFSGNVPDDVEIRAGLVFFENNPFWTRGVKAKVYYPGGAWEQGNSVELCGEKAPWLNLTGKFGIVLRGTKSVSIEDGQLVLNHRPAGSGELAKCAVAVFYPRADVAATKRADAVVKVVEKDGAVDVELGDARVLLGADLKGVATR